MRTFRVSLNDPAQTAVTVRGEDAWTDYGELHIGTRNGQTKATFASTRWLYYEETTEDAPEKPAPAAGWIPAEC